jgi:GNAT superfamily N-acetyltransferase
VTRELVVRPATLDDLDAIVELRLALLREYANHPFYSRLRPDVRLRAYELYRTQLSSPYEIIFIAERSRHVVGVLRCVETATSPVLLPERYCYVSSAYVAAGERKKGVLRTLVAAAETWCDERGLSEMRLHNSSRSGEARAAWSALGFDVVEEVRRREVHVKNAAPLRANPTRSIHGAT